MKKKITKKEIKNGYAIRKFSEIQEFMKQLKKYQKSKLRKK